MATDSGRVLSISVGGVRKFEYRGHPAQSAIWKSPVSGRIAARGVNLTGDRQADLEAHGGPDKVVYAYAVEDARRWEREVGSSLSYGAFGENLTTEGIEVNDALVGERWRIGSAAFEVSEPRIPCWRLGVRMNDEMFPRRFSKAMRPGTYLRIVIAGDVCARDEISVIEKPAHDVSIRDVFRIYTRDRHEVARLLAIRSSRTAGGAGWRKPGSQGQRVSTSGNGGSALPKWIHWAVIDSAQARRSADQVSVHFRRVPRESCVARRLHKLETEGENP